MSNFFFLHSFAQGTVFHADANCPLINLFVSVCVVNNSKEGNFSSSNRGSHSSKDFNFVQKLFVLFEKLTATWVLIVVMSESPKPVVAILFSGIVQLLPVYLTQTLFG